MIVAIATFLTVAAFVYSENTALKRKIIVGFFVCMVVAFLLGLLCLTAFAIHERQPEAALTAGAVAGVVSWLSIDTLLSDYFGLNREENKNKFKTAGLFGLAIFLITLILTIELT